MEITDFLTSMKKFTEEAVADLRLPQRAQKKGEEPEPRAPTVYRMRIPDSGASDKLTPYILHQIVTTDDLWPVGERAERSVLLRSVFCVYYPMAEDNPAEDEGQLILLEVMQRWRIAVLRKQILDGRYRIDLRKEPLEGLYYPDKMSPYYVGEFASNWQIPAIELSSRRELLELADGDLRWN